MGAEPATFGLLVQCSANTSVRVCDISKLRQLAISQLRTAKHLWIVWRDKAKWQKTLKVKIRARNYKRCLITSKKKPQKLFAVSVPCLMTGALYRTVPPNNPCMLCGLNYRKWLIVSSISVSFCDFTVIVFGVMYSDVKLNVADVL